jgi:hypothetical protein
MASSSDHFQLSPSSNRFRAAVNVMGDGFGAGIIEAVSKNELKRLTAKSLSIP